MIAIDTNVLVRYITNDDEEQSILAANLLEKYSGKEKSIFINNIVLCELVWVLLSGYKYKKIEIVRTLKLFLSSIELTFENYELAFLAVTEYENNAGDFSDILIGLINNHQGYQTYSFDKQALKSKYFVEL
jgi:predicted nucleic-acid-binding protein